MRYFAFGLTIDTAIHFDGVLRHSSAQPDVTITEGTVVEKAYRPTRLYRRGIQAKLGLHKTGIVLNWEGVGKFRMSDGNQITYQSLGADEGTLRLFLLSEVLGICLYQRGLFLLHASAVQVGDEAWVFMGVPGAGKSTTATAFGKAGYTVLTDDLVAIMFVADKPYIVPAFSQYKVWKNALQGLRIDTATLEPSFEGADKFLVTQHLDRFPDEPVLLRQLTILQPPNSRGNDMLIKPIQAPIELLKHFPLPVQLLTSEYLQQHFKQTLKLAQSTSIYRMKRPRDFQALEAFVHTIGSEKFRPESGVPA